MASYCLVHNLFKLESMTVDACWAAQVDFFVDFEASICNLLNWGFSFVYSTAEESNTLGIAKRPFKCYTF